MKYERFVGTVLSLVVGVTALLSLVPGNTSPDSGSGQSVGAVTLPAMSTQALLVELEECETSGPEGCVLSWSKKALAAMGAKEAVQLVSSSSNPTLQRSCHGVMHDLGRLSANGKPLSEVQELIRAGAAVCQFGFQHGVLIGVSESVVADKEFSSIMAKACDAFPKTGNTYSSCVHGIGHAASSRYPDDLNRAGALCASLGSIAGWCASGAVMEWGASSAAALKRSEGGPAKATETCNSFETVAGDAGYKECVREMPAILFAGQVSRGEIASWCATVGEDVVKEACADGLGFTFGTELTVAPEAVSTACSPLGEARFVGRCAAAAGGMYYQRDVSRNKEAAVAMCAALEQAEKKACDEYLAQTFSSVSATITS